MRNQWRKKSKHLPVCEESVKKGSGRMFGCLWVLLCHLFSSSSSTHPSLFSPYLFGAKKKKKKVLSPPSLQFLLICVRWEGESSKKPNLTGSVLILCSFPSFSHFFFEKVHAALQAIFLELLPFEFLFEFPFDFFSLSFFSLSLPTSYFLLFFPPLSSFPFFRSLRWGNHGKLDGQYHPEEPPRRSALLDFAQVFYLWISFSNYFFFFFEFLFLNSFFSLLS